MKKKLLGLGLALSLVGNVYLILRLVDAGIVLDNATSEVDLLWKRRQVALEIISRGWVGRPVGELDEVAGDLNDDGVLVGHDGDAREIGDFIFEVENGLVTDVRDLDSIND
jgi:hypothetical protein